MAICPKCNAEAVDGARFCGVCGASLCASEPCTCCEEEKAAPVPESNLESTVPSEPAFVSEPAPETAAFTEETPTAAPATAPAATKKPFPKMAVLFGAIGIVAIAVIVLVVSLLLGRGSNDEYAFYLKDKELYFTDFDEDSPSLQITDKLFGDEEIENDSLSYAGYVLGYYTYLSEDGEYLFYPDKCSDGINLYMKNMKDSDAEAVKIDSDVDSYYVDPDVSFVIYIKASDGDRNLYRYDIKDDNKEKIASDVESFACSKDGKKLYYTVKNEVEGEKEYDEDGYTKITYDLYVKIKDNDKEKLASEISYLEHISDDFKTVYYIKEGALYKHTEGNEREKLISDVHSIIKIYESGEIYYVTSGTNEIALMDYVIDDMKDADAALVRPEEPNYPTAPQYPDYTDYYDIYGYVDWDAYYAAQDQYYIDYEEYEEEYSRLYTEYYEALEEYWEKESGKSTRDYIREALAESKYEQTVYSLYFFDGNEKKLLAESMTSSYDYELADEVPVIIYHTYTESEIAKVKISEIESAYDVEDKIREAMRSDTQTFIASKATATKVEEEKKATAFCINEAGTIVYYIDEIADEKDYGTLYRINIENGTVGKPEKYDSDVCYDYCYFIGETEFRYFKECKNEKGELYVDKVRIDYDAYVYSVSYDEEEDRLVYFIDWNDEKSQGTLKVYDGDNVTKISDEVYTYYINADGRILYLYDYSTTKYRGELYAWNDGESKKIDDDVNCVIRIYDMYE